MAATDEDRGNFRATADGWLRLLREGTPAQKALARTELGVIFERLGMPEMAVEAYMGNVRRRVPDRRVYQRLAAVLIALGDHRSAGRVNRIGQRLSDESRARSEAEIACLLCGDWLEPTCSECSPLEDSNEVGGRDFFHCSCPADPDGRRIPFNGSTRLEDLERKRAHYRSTGWMNEQRVRELRAVSQEPAGRYRRLAGTAGAWVAGSFAAFTLLIAVGSVTASAFFAPIFGALSVFHPQGGPLANLWVAGSIFVAGILIMSAAGLIVGLAGKRWKIQRRLRRQ